MVAYMHTHTHTHTHIYLPEKKNPTGKSTQNDNTHTHTHTHAADKSRDVNRRVISQSLDHRVAIVMFLPSLLVCTVLAVGRRLPRAVSVLALFPRRAIPPLEKMGLVWPGLGSACTGP